MRNHKLIADTIKFLCLNKNNNYYIDDVYEIINNNEFGLDNSNDLLEIINKLRESQQNDNNLHYNLRILLYRIIDRNNGTTCLNKLNCNFQ